MKLYLGWNGTRFPIVAPDDATLQQLLEQLVHVITPPTASANPPSVDLNILSFSRNNEPYRNAVDCADHSLTSLGFTDGVDTINVVNTLNHGGHSPPKDEAQIAVDCVNQLLTSLGTANSTGRVNDVAKCTNPTPFNHIDPPIEFTPVSRFFNPPRQVLMPPPQAQAVPIRFINPPRQAMPQNHSAAASADQSGIIGASNAVNVVENCAKPTLFNHSHHSPLKDLLQDLQERINDESLPSVRTECDFVSALADIVFNMWDFTAVKQLDRSDVCAATSQSTASSTAAIGIVADEPFPGYRELQYSFLPSKIANPPTLTIYLAVFGPAVHITGNLNYHRFSSMLTYSVASRLSSPFPAIDSTFCATKWNLIHPVSVELMDLAMNVRQDARKATHNVVDYITLLNLPGFLVTKIFSFLEKSDMQRFALAGKIAHSVLLSVNLVKDGAANHDE